MPIKSLYPYAPEYPEINVLHALLRRPDQAQWSNFPLHIDAETGQSRGFRDFIQRVEWAATALGSPVDKGGLGLSADKGDIIGLMSENCMDYVTFAHTCYYITTPFALISSYSKPFELRNALILSKATCLFIDAKFLPMALPVAKEVGIPLTRIFVMTGQAPGHKSFSQLIDEVRAKKIAIVDVRPAKRNTLAYLVFSSGTTGLPKAVMISHGNLLGTISQLSILVQTANQKSINSNEPPKALVALPLHHTAGFVGTTLGMFLLPITGVIMSRWNIDLALDHIPKYRINRLHLVPSLVHQLVHHPKLPRTDLSSITAASCGAAYLSPGLAEKLSSFLPQFADFVEGYGMSESTFSTLRKPSPGAVGGQIKPKRGSTGVLMPNLVARIVREDGTDADVNEVGELWTKGPTVSMGYLNNEKSTNETFVDGWLKSGDKFRVDEDGHFFFADRAKDTLKVSGAQVSPVEIEDLLLAHPKKLIDDVTVAGVSGGRTSDEKIPRAWIVLSNEGEKLGEAVVIKELERWHQENLTKYKWLRGGFEVVKEIPKSPTGKVLRRELQDRFEQRFVHTTTKTMSKL